MTRAQSLGDVVGKPTPYLRLANTEVVGVRKLAGSYVPEVTWSKRRRRTALFQQGEMRLPRFGVEGRPLQKYVSVR